jgi:DNA-binding SARP family transcriptional activator
MILSAFRDDPAAPVPAFTGDFVDAPLARALFSRGLLAELRHGRSTWALMTGVPAIGGVGGLPEAGFQLPRFVGLYRSFGESIQVRDYETARACRDELAALPTPWGALAEAELAIRLERDGRRASQAIERLRTLGPGRVVVFRELAATWEAAAHLLADEPQAAAEVLREAVASMRRGDRTLALSRALVYLAEAEWRLGNEDASDQAADEAYEVARRQGSLRELLLSLADFPGVLSRRLDVERASESPWHSLGRALVHEARGPGTRVVAPVSAHLREFGEPALIVDGHRVVRPKIRKSLELLSYLLSSAKGSVSREEVLTALWNGRDDDSTRAYLRQALRHLRDVLPEGISVTAEGDSLSVEGAVTSESHELEAQLAEAARDPGPGRLGYLLEALELAGRGEFLAGSSDVRWVDDRRARLESVISDVRLDAAELLLDADRHLRALALVDETLDADPLLERAWRLRMRALGLLGDYDGVTAAYAQCTSALAEIGLEPSSATSELARSLRR